MDEQALAAVVASSTFFETAAPTALERVAWELHRGVILPPGGPELRELLQPLLSFMAGDWRGGRLGAFSDHYFQKAFKGRPLHRNHSEELLLQEAQASLRQWRLLCEALGQVAEEPKRYNLRGLMREFAGVHEPLKSWDSYHRYQALTFQVEEAYEGWRRIHPEEDCRLGEWAEACEVREEEWRETAAPF